MKVTEDMHLILVTESGSEYEIKNWKVRRINEGSVKRGDGEWHQLLTPPYVILNQPVTLVMESLSRYGRDDHGHSGESFATFRTTSRVVTIKRGGEYA